ncbi:MAG: hypothetical protein M1817_003114 [Caeruleum heppii]|nr:MAG: hypothetical protein M1817_003114 [Caeruleum heppii]
MNNSSALDAACHAVSLFEDDPLFNCSRGAVFTRDGTIELEASIMVSKGKIKRGVGVMLLKRVKLPILLAKEIMLRGEDDDGTRTGGGAYGHVQLSGAKAEELAERWGLEMVDPGYFWTKKRWDQHKRARQRDQRPGRDQYDVQMKKLAEEYLSQGTVGAVALDSSGVLCVCTSTGGMGEKLSGRIGDTPTIGAGFFAEEFDDSPSRGVTKHSVDHSTRGLTALPAFGSLLRSVSSCFPSVD